MVRANWFRGAPLWSGRKASSRKQPLGDQVQRIHVKPTGHLLHGFLRCCQHTHQELDTRQSRCQPLPLQLVQSLVQEQVGGVEKAQISDSTRSSSSSGME